MTVIGHVVAVTAATLGLAAWSVLVLGFTYARVFVPREKKDPKAVLSPRVATQVFTVTAVACIAGAALVLAAIALLAGDRTPWAWTGAGTGTAFFATFGGAFALARYRELAGRT